MSKTSNKFLNDVKKRFLSLPRSAVEGLEHEPKKSDFNFIKELGIGSFGTVYLVSHKKTKAKYALKAIDKTSKENLEEKDIFNREVEIMYKLNHPNIVKLYGHFEDEKYCYFIMQYIPNRTLFDLVPKEGEKPNINIITSIMKDLLCAVYYLHNMKPTIIHRDIKPENILLDQNSKAYLTDFGWSNYIDEFTRRNTVCGTPLYLPPEMISQLGHDETADIWCIGILLFELITGTTPFEGNDIDTVAFNITKLKITWPKNMDSDAKDLIHNILKLNGKDRLSIEQILNHKFFKKHFPNATKDLIKPDNQKIRTFVISKDDPKKWENETKAAFNKEQNIIKNTSINLNKNNNNRNNNIIHNNNDKIKNDNKQYKKINIRTTFIPRTRIDLSNTEKKNNNKVSIISSYNSQFNVNKCISTNSCDKNKYNNFNCRNIFNNSNKNNITITYSNNNRSNNLNTYKNQMTITSTRNNNSNIYNNIKYKDHSRLNNNPNLQYSSNKNNNYSNRARSDNTKYIYHSRLNINPNPQNSSNSYISQNKNEKNITSDNNRRNYRPETAINNYSNYNVKMK